MTEQISLVLPCKNEEYYVRYYAENKLYIQDYDEIIVVLNNSTDQTEALLNELMKTDKRLKVLTDNREEKGVGYGYAIMTGLQAATGDFVVVADCDGTYPLEDFSLLAAMKTAEADVLLTERFPRHLTKSKAGNLQSFGTWLLSQQAQLLLGVKSKDILSGMCCFRQAAIEPLLSVCKAGDWNFSIEIKLAALLNEDLKVIRRPIRQEERSGVSKQRYFKTGFQHFSYLLSYRKD